MFLLLLLLLLLYGNRCKCVGKIVAGKMRQLSAVVPILFKKNVMRLSE